MHWGPGQSLATGSSEALSPGQACAQRQTCPRNWDAGADESKAQERKQIRLFWTVTSFTCMVKWLEEPLQSKY